MQIADAAGRHSKPRSRATLLLAVCSTPRPVSTTRLHAIHDFTTFAENGLRSVLVMNPHGPVSPPVSKYRLHTRSYSVHQNFQSPLHLSFSSFRICFARHPHLHPQLHLHLRCKSLWYVRLRQARLTKCLQQHTCKFCSNTNVKFTSVCHNVSLTKHCVAVLTYIH